MKAPSWLRPLRGPRARRPAPPRFGRPQLEPLEERLAPVASVSYEDLVTSMVLDPGNNLYVAGNIANNADLRGTGTAHQWLQGPARFVAEYDSSGALVWAKPFADLFGADGGIVGGVNALAAFTDPVSGQTSLYLSRSNYATSTFWISKLAADGTVLWNMQTGRAGSLAVDSAGFAYVLGSFSGTADFDPQHPGLHTLTANGQDAFLLKVSASGDFQWLDQLGGAGTQWANSVAVEGSTVYATGMFNQTFAPANFTERGVLAQSASADGYLAKYDTSGTYLAAYQFADASPGPVAVDGGAVYLAGTFDRTADLSPDPNTPYLVTPMGGSPSVLSPSDVFLEKLNGDGTLAWARQIGSTGYDTAGSLAVRNSLVYLSGGFSSTVDFDPGPGQYNLTAGGDQDGFVAQYSAAGAFGWARQMGSSVRYPVTPAAEQAARLAVSDGGVYTAGYFAPGPASFGPNITLTGSGDHDGFVSKQDLSGNFQWAFQVESVVRTLDDGDTGYSEAGSGWKSNTSGGFQVDSRYHTKGSGAERATWSFTNLPAGTYQVEATWVAANTNASNAPYTVNGGAAVLVNQQVRPGDVVSDLGSTPWKILGTYTVGPDGALTVRLSDAANGRVVADGARVVLQAPAAALMASGAPAAAPMTLPALTGQQLQRLVPEAIRRWAEAGASAAQLRTLRAAHVVVADLPGSELGLAVGRTIRIDANAAGWGWFVDRTPRNDSEFSKRGNQGEQGRMDLLSVVMHEMGHVLGLGHAHEGVMQETLAAGERLLPEANGGVPHPGTAASPDVWSDVAGLLDALGRHRGV